MVARSRARSRDRDKSELGVSVWVCTYTRRVRAASSRRALGATCERAGHGTLQHVN